MPRTQKLFHEERARRLVEARGWNLSELHYHAAKWKPRMAWTTLHNSITGKQMPRLDAFYAIVRALETSADYLLGLSDAALPEGGLQHADIIPLARRLDALPDERRPAVATALLALLDAFGVNSGRTDTVEMLGSLARLSDDRKREFARLIRAAATDGEEPPPPAP
jgi:hypothetical protein